MFILERNQDWLESQIKSMLLQTGSTLLHLNAFKGDVEILKDILSRNMLNPFTQNKQGDTCLHVAIRRNNVDFAYEIINWSISQNISVEQAEVENTVEHLTPFMTAVLRDQFEIANILIKNNLATRTYRNIEGRDIHQIAEDANKVRALAYLEDREIPRQVYNRNGSVDMVNGTNSLKSRNSQRGNNKAIVLDQTKFDRRKQSVETSSRRDDIFGKSFVNEKNGKQI